MRQDIQEDTSTLWMRHMRSGAFEKAWETSDAELKARAGKPCWHLPRHFQYVWDGTSLQGRRVLVRCYHGLGDTIQFIRYMPLLQAVAAEVLVWAQPPLIPLLETVPGIDQLLPLHDGTPDVAYDADVEIMELSHIFRTTLATIPSEIPYLQVEPQHLSSHNGKLAVGLVWKAGDWDGNRSIPFSLLAPLAEIQGIRLYILQADAVAAGWQEGFGVHPGEFSLYDYARVISGLDLLITVDSMPAHLAGALGVPVWTLLHAKADWRWMDNREDSPWYPTMRLFRQEQPGDWRGVIARITAELEKLSSLALNPNIK
ncbi:ADP-heptose--LPS heptosyltransferase [Pontibacter sp. 172403-2]|uniref:glycosyltransferase family 9 protein n=1 Tax=Pontibacter rufus TaxID=2791028 RepID=UPI0018AF8683|nr:glycosyltransferase family 9 protein [Pontibacter sp. 172403-2]MBF9252991.1 ADP-heptose--LPS heptosyltransferase [Pontibacter sp. 172403-2]